VATVGACGSRTPLLVPEEEAFAPEAGPSFDAGTPDATFSCDLGQVTGDVFGQTALFAGGRILAAGRYRVSYVGGCMKYSSSQAWIVNAYPLGSSAGSDHWWFVASGQNVDTAIPPGTVGFLSGQGAFTNFDDCVHASLAVPPVDLVLSEGTLGVWLEDEPYGDNVPGVNGDSPTWSLECLP
jgi:hypothetical protein